MTIKTRHCSFTDVSISKGFLYLLTFFTLSLSHLSHGKTCATSECSSEESKEIMQEMYVAYYGRPAEPSGLQYWADRLSADSNLDDILAAFGTSAEYNDNYGQLTNAELIEGLYQQMFSRDPDPSGLEFYTHRLESGEASLASIAKQIADGALNSDAITLENRVSAAMGYSNILPNPCGFTGCNYDWPTVKTLLALLDDNTSTESIAAWGTQTIKLTQYNDGPCENCIWQDDSQSFSLTGRDFLIESLPQTTLSFLKTIEISKTVDVAWDCAELAMVYPSVSISNGSDTTTYRSDSNLGCHDKAIAESDFALLEKLIKSSITHDTALIQANQEPEHLIAIDPNYANPTIILEHPVIDDEENFDSFEPSVLVYTNRGAIQCESDGISAEESEQTLQNASIETINTHCGVDHLIRPAVCGYSSGEMVLHKIGQSRLAFAEELGYKSIYSLQQEMETEDVYMQVNCD